VLYPYTGQTSTTNATLSKCTIIFTNAHNKLIIINLNNTMSTFQEPQTIRGVEVSTGESDDFGILSF
jgi:hypothetical protein